MANVIDGRAVAAAIRRDVAHAVRELEDRAGVTPGLAVVLVGDDPASQVYVRMKERACTEVGIRSDTHRLTGEAGQHELLNLVRRLGDAPDVHGILVQFPLPSGFDTEAVVEAIPPEKDVDGFHPVNVGRLLRGTEGFIPCTPAGVMKLIAETGRPLSGARAVVVGRSLLVGRPLACLLLQQDATVTICHSRTKDLADEVRQAEILVAAAGRPGLVRGDWVRPGAVVIDVGVNRLPDGSLTGDVDFNGAQARAEAITPVPGGVGPMTVAMLLANTVRAARLRSHST